MTGARLKELEAQANKLVFTSASPLRELIAEVRRLRSIINRAAAHRPPRGGTPCCSFCGQLEGEDPRHTPDCPFVNAR